MITLEEQIEECRLSVNGMRKLAADMERDRDILNDDMIAVRRGLAMAEAILATMESVPTISTRGE